MKRLARHSSWLLSAAVSLALLAFVLRGADLGRAAAVVRGLGPWLPLLLLPNLISLLSDTSGWWLSLARIGYPLRFRCLLGVRASGDALLLSLPSGSVVSETIQPYLLKRRCGLPLELGIAATIARKFLVVVAHACLLLTTTLLAWPLLDRASRIAIGRGGLPWLLVVCALGLLLAALAGAAVSVRSRVADRLHRVLTRIVGRWLAGWLERNALRFRHTDEALAGLFGRPRALAAPVLLHVVGWSVRALETFLILRLVGIEIPVAAAIAVEASVVLVRVVASPVPGGLGVQDLSYVLCLRALGVEDPTTLGAAFVVLKRSKDLVWILAGLALLGHDRRQGRLEPHHPHTAVTPAT